MTVIDTLGTRTRTSSDGLGRQWRVQEGGAAGSETFAAETQFQYAPNGQMTALISGGPDGSVATCDDNQVTTYTYTDQGQPATTTYPDAFTVTNTYYENNGSLRTVTDQRSVKTEYAYTTDEIVADEEYHTRVRRYVADDSVAVPEGDRELLITHDGLGRPIDYITKATPGGTQTSRVTNCYEFCGKIGRQDQQLGGTGAEEWRVFYDYDSSGRLSKMLWPYIANSLGGISNYVSHEDYDDLNRAATIKNYIDGTPTTVAEYTFVGHRVATKTYPQSTAAYTVEQTYWSSAEDNFDNYGRLTRSHAVSDPAGTPDDLVDLNYKPEFGITLRDRKRYSPQIVIGKEAKLERIPWIGKNCFAT